MANLVREAFASNRELRDACQTFAQEASGPLEEMLGRYACAIMEVETKFRVLEDQFSRSLGRNVIEHIETRLKSVDSIANKLERGGHPITLEAVEGNVFDGAGVRVVCSFVDDIFLLAKCLESQDDIKIVKQKNYIGAPKPNGYRSLHLIVEVPVFLAEGKRMMKVEVQLRTIAMDFWASLEHELRYKKNLPEDVRTELNTDLLECAEMSAELDARMLAARNRLAEGLAHRRRIGNHLESV